MGIEMAKDRYGNEIDPVHGFAWGKLISGPESLNLRFRWAQELMKRRYKRYGQEAIYNLTGLYTHFPSTTEDLGPPSDDLVGPAIWMDRLKRIGIEHLGGDIERHHVAFCNRLSSGQVATILSIVKPGEILVCYSAPPKGFTHSSILLGSKLVGAECLEANTAEEFNDIVEKYGDRVSLVVITGTSTALKSPPIEELKKVIEISREHKIFTYLDDASGARLRPVLLMQPKSLELGVDIAGTSGEKLLPGPRSGWIAGDRDLVERIETLLITMGADLRPALSVALLRGLENYDPELLRKMKAMGEKIYRLAKGLYGDRVKEIPFGIHILHDDGLDIVIEKADARQIELVPVEASIGTGVSLLEDYGVITVAGAWSAGSTPSIRIKPVPEEGMRFGGPEKIIEVLDKSFERVAVTSRDMDGMRKLLFGDLMM